MSDSYLRPRHPVLLLTAVIGVLIASLGFFASAQAATLTVDPAAGCSSTGPTYCTIQQAIDAAADGDTISIADGIYIESLNIYKPLTLEGASRDGVIIDASGFVDY